MGVAPGGWAAENQQVMDRIPLWFQEHWRQKSGSCFLLWLKIRLNKDLGKAKHKWLQGGKTSPSWEQLWGPDLSLSLYQLCDWDGLEANDSTSVFQFPHLPNNSLRLYLFCLFSNLLLAVLCLHCCAQAFSSYGEQGLLSSFGARASHGGGFSRGQALGHKPNWLGCVVLASLWHVGSSWIRDWTQVACIGLRIL